MRKVLDSLNSMPYTVSNHCHRQQQVVTIRESEKVCVRDVERPHKSIECAFDRVFGRDSTQEDVFMGLVPALDTVMKGFNACVLAYGQTGSGKTHTLIGTGTIDRTSRRVRGDLRGAVR